MTVRVVFGTQWGDEGKGKAIDVFASDYDYVARYNGGNNAGHTIVNEFGTFKIHLVPSGVFAPKIVGLIGGGAVSALTSGGWCMRLMSCRRRASTLKGGFSFRRART